MLRKKRASKQLRVKPPAAGHILLLATIRLEEGSEVPCDVDLSLPGC